MATPAGASSTGCSCFLRTSCSCGWAGLMWPCSWIAIGRMTTCLTICRVNASGVASRSQAEPVALADGGGIPVLQGSKLLQPPPLLSLVVRRELVSGHWQENTMRAQRVIVLHTEPSRDPNDRAGAAGVLAGCLRISVLDAGSPDLLALREKPGFRGEAPKFNVKLIKPLDFSDGTATAAAPPLVSWGVTAVGASDSQFDGSGVVVAVLDTGIDRNHAAFAGMQEKIVEKDFTGEGEGDLNGHGTHCAGTICGRNVNGTRIGVARGVKKLLIAKVLDKDGIGSTDAIANAIQWALEKGAHIISMSLGMDFPGIREALKKNWPEEVATSMALEGYRENVRFFDRLAATIAAGEFLGRRALIVAATGNESHREISASFTIAKGPPASAEGILAVGAIELTNNPDKQFNVAPVANTKADLAAPGVEIWSAKRGGGLQAMKGTSMATPHVAGVAALWAHKSIVDNEGDVVIGEVIDNLRDHAKRTTGLTREDVGKGVVQAPA